MAMNDALMAFFKEEAESRGLNPDDEPLLREYPWWTTHCIAPKQAVYGNDGRFVCNRSKFSAHVVRMRSERQLELQVTIEGVAEEVNKMLLIRRAPGGARALSPEAELRVVRRLQDTEDRLKLLTFDIVTMELLREAGLPQTPDEVNNDEILQAGVLKRVALLGKDGVNGFLKRHEAVRTRARHLEEQRAAATQPEKMAQYARLIVFAFMRAQVMRACLIWSRC
jgi:hypothetical protein